MKKKPKTELECMEKGICPRCLSGRHSTRLDGGVVCKHCGQRWTKESGMVPSFDRRNNSPEKEENMEQEDLTIDKIPDIMVVKKSRGRPAFPVGAIRTRKDGKVVIKDEDGKWIELKEKS
jgi:hypothetical protein